MHFIVRGRSGHGAILALCLVLASGMAAAAGPDAVADISITPGQVSWSPNVKAEKWSLTVSGPGIHLREVFEKGGPVRLQTTAPDGERLADGSYNWELRAIKPEIGQGAQTQQSPPKQRRLEGTEIDPGQFERRYVARPVVTSGSFQVQGGGFVMPRQEPGESESSR